MVTPASSSPTSTALAGPTSRRRRAGHRGRRDGRHRPRPPGAPRPAPRSCRSSPSRSCASGWRGLRGGRARLPARAGRRRLPVPEPPGPAPYVERFVLEGQSPACPRPRSRRWPSSPTSSRSPAPDRVDPRRRPDAVLRTLQARGYVDQVGRDPGPGQAVLWGTTGQFLENARPGLGGRPATDRRLRPRRRGGRGPGGRACADTSLSIDDGDDDAPTTAGGGPSPRHPPTVVPEPQPNGPATDRPASACRRCWPSGATAAAAPARSSSPQGGSGERSRWPGSAGGSSWTTTRWRWTVTRCR